MARGTSLGRRLLGHVGVAVLVSLLVGILPGTARATTSPAAVQHLVQRSNEERAAAGVAGLTPRDELASVAQRWSASMAESEKLAHNPDLATEVTCWRVLLENVGVDHLRGTSEVETAERLHRLMMSSDGHRRNLLNPDVTEVGVGVEVRSGRMWVTVVLRRPTACAGPADTPPPAAPTPAPAAVASPSPDDASQSPDPPAVLSAPVHTSPGPEPTPVATVEGSASSHEASPDAPVRAPARSYRETRPPTPPVARPLPADDIEPLVSVATRTSGAPTIGAIVSGRAVSPDVMHLRGLAVLILTITCHVVTAARRYARS